MRAPLTLALALLVPRLLAAQAPAQGAAPCSAPGYRAADFWVGRWSLTNARGQAGGSSRVELVAGKCAFVEYFASPDSSFVGVGLHTFDAATQVWTQYWTDTRGITLVMRGTMSGATLTYEWTAPVAGTPRPQRYTVAPQPDGSVLQTGFATTDEGKTWTPAWRLTYRSAIEAKE